jgi:hypothetical protein
VRAIGERARYIRTARRDMHDDLGLTLRFLSNAIILERSA